MLDPFKAWGREDITLEQHSYHEAGHAVMYYVLKTGLETEFVPLGKGQMLPPFPGVRPVPHSWDWAELTFNLGSMLTVAQLLLGGWIALNEKLGADKVLDKKSVRIRVAHHMISAYAEEMVRENLKERDRVAEVWLNEMHASVRRHIQASWAAVEALAEAIRSAQDDLTEEEAFALIKAALNRSAR